MNGIKVRAFGKLYLLFQQKGLTNPAVYYPQGPVTAAELGEALGIPARDVEAVFVNHSIRPLSTPLKDGDRVAFVPPGIPSIHRFNLGFYAAKEEE